MDFFGKCDQIHWKPRILSFTEEIHNGKLDFLCNVNSGGSEKI